MGHSISIWILRTFNMYANKKYISEPLNTACSFSPQRQRAHERMNALGSICSERTPLVDGSAPRTRPGRADVHRRVESTRVDLRRIGALGLVVFCFATTIGLVHVVTLTTQVLNIVQQDRTHASTTSSLFPVAENTHVRAAPAVSSAPDSDLNPSLTANVLVVYTSETPHLTKLASSVADGAASVHGIDPSQVRLRTVANATFADDVQWADAILLGSHVVNANVDPQMLAFISSWDFRVDMSNKVGAAFVTSGGLSAGEELTMVNLLHSMLIFRMVVVGGERWTSAFGASAIVGESPFQPLGNAGVQDFPQVCYPTDPADIHTMFKAKAFGLGERATTVFGRAVERPERDGRARNATRERGLPPTEKVRDTVVANETGDATNEPRVLAVAAVDLDERLDRPSRAKWIWITIALIGVIVSLAWPLIEDKLIVKGAGCPWPFSMFHTPSPKAASTGATAIPADSDLPPYTLEQLRAHDGSDPDKPILLAIGGKVLDVTKGKKFYGPGATYHQFAGRACTRALTLSSLDLEDINDDTSDFDDSQKQELEETKAFYYEKYPIVGVLKD
ncbi:TPA: hypothetical protein N0F65_003499 [Lagenidium giganteum]|uniref:Cytochrome b5 heme-binding domain-containing protein n=1 Tax=Lagenidium giganteum TaxID=4803 RepID=A0AAV2YMA8_9STRA|nr:TPA: hypothetical protein N0F65_003499 [Lagenidium giganteum]